MKVLNKFVSVFVSSLLLSGIASAQDNPEFKPELESIYDNIILKNASIASQNCRQLEEKIKLKVQDPTNTDYADKFLAFVDSWRAVQTDYILGDLSEDYLDHPNLIDTFHNGKEDFVAVLKRALEGDTAADKALFKNSTKSLNSLEYVLYGDSVISTRDLEFAQVMVASICKRVGDIEQGYKEAKSTYLENPNKSLASLVNALSTSIFTTKEWRIGDPAGLTRKYLDKPDHNRSEMPYSSINFRSLKAVYKAQKELLDPNSEHKNLFHILDKFKVKKVGEEINETLNQVIAKLDPISSDFDLFKPETIKPIYELSNKLYKLYYVSLISELPVVAKVMDADGD
ncbi:imelysin family protein [Taylorella equigenitalis]|uniref:imelysin family protein n=1 Tax=Taylorella equigenitalis TaxID=29575 RepID=UPI0003F92ACB|nr:imelysin family protein [Taylorella equigenitalis]ASY41344.1 hypothetical protein CAV20_06735 [Taylorella equigenitalis]WDU53232.1 hypothetical protein KNO31_06810 [Taylorella equigenitalis]